MREHFNRCTVDAKLVSWTLAASLVLVAVPALAGTGIEARLVAAPILRPLAGGGSLKLNQPIGTTHDRFGNVYIADTGNNRVVKVDRDGRLLLEIGVAGPARTHLYLPSDVAVDRRGFIYVADTMNHRAVKFDPQGRFRAAWGGLHGPSSLTVGPDGYVYIADTMAHRVVKMTRQGKLVQTWGREGSGPGELRFPRDIAIGATGVYVTDFVNHRVVKFSTEGRFLQAWGSHGSGPGQFNHPWGLTLDAQENIWVVDLSNKRIQRISQQTPGSVLVRATTIGQEDPTPGEWYGDETKTIEFEAATTATVPSSSVSTRQAGSTLHFIVARSGDNRVDRLDLDPSQTVPYVTAPAVDNLASALVPLHPGGRVSSFASAEKLGDKLQYPFAARMGADGLTYIADTGNSRIVVVDARGRAVRSWGGFGSAPGQLNLPSDLALDAAGNVLVADTMNNRVQKFSATGALLASWGSEKEFRAPHGLAIAADGSVFVADTLGHRIVRYTAGGKPMTSWGGQGSGPAELSFPHGLAVDGGYVYVADFLNHRVSKFTLEGEAVETWGQFGEGPSEFRHPWGIALGPDHSVWVSDMTNSRIQRFTEFGTLMGIYGGYGTELGHFDHPKAIDVNADGRMAVGVAGLHSVDLFTGAGDR